MTIYLERNYRQRVHRCGLISFHVVVKETDLQIHASKPLKTMATNLVLQFRGYIESYGQKHPEFLKTLIPWHVNGPAPQIINDMAEAGAHAGVGPMAAVAGALAEHVGQALMPHSNEVIVENGGDIFLKINEPVTIGIFAGKSPLSMRLGLRFRPKEHPFAVCTSSGTIGHSLSMGRADAVCTVSTSCAGADAAATAIGNLVKKKSDIQKAIDFGKQIEGLSGIIVIIKDKIGLWGDIEVVRLKGKKG